MSKVLKVKVTSPWIPVENKKPEPFKYVLAYYPDCKNKQKVNIVWMSYNGTWSLDDSKTDDVYFGAPSHWMPLPNVPEV